MSHKHIIVIGGGFAGVNAAIHLIRARQDEFQLTLIDPTPEAGRGIAYSTALPGHLINGPAKLFSLYPSEPDHLVKWLDAHAATLGWSLPAGVGFPDAFVPRWVYGDYVRDEFARALADAAGRVTYKQIRSRAIDLAERGGHYTVATADGGHVTGDTVILATGLFPKLAKHGYPVSRELKQSPALIGDIWNEANWRGVAEAKSLLIVGSSLTALDAMISAEAHGFRGTFTVMSRHDLLVQTRREVAPWPDLLDPANLPMTVRELLRAVQPVRRKLRDEGGDWQRLPGAIRPHLPTLWANASARERRRFIRHVRRFWEVSLHRAAPEAGKALERIVSQDRLNRLAGQIEFASLQPGGKVEVQWRPSGASATRRNEFDRIVNANGFEFDWARIDDPLIRNLLDRGHVQRHSTGFGIEANPLNGAVRLASGEYSSQLFAVGHPLRGASWESNAIGEQTLEAVATARFIGNTPSLAAAGQEPESLQSTLARLRERAPAADRAGQYDPRNIADLHRHGLTALAVPRSHGGADLPLSQVAPLIGQIAAADPSTALIVLMQTLHHRAIQTSHTWPRHIADTVFNAAVKDGALINALRVEPALGSPVRGGIPATKARRTEQGWRLSGHKLYSTGAPGLTWGIVWGATDEAEPRIGEFLVPLSAPGVKIVDTWDHLGLRASGSHDVIFEDVLIPHDHAVDLRTPLQWQQQDIGLSAWLPVMLSALYDGVARAARDWTLPWIRERNPSNLKGSLADLPRFQSAIGEIDAWLQTNALLIEQAAAAVDRQATQAGTALGIQPALIKYTVTQNAIAAVEKALSLLGNHALTRSNPLERHYRDVLCSRVHQPQNDLILEGAGRAALLAPTAPTAPATPPVPAADGSPIHADRREEVVTNG